MSETISIDGKGRLVLPKKIRDQAHIGVNGKLIARASRVGTVELSDPKVLSARAREIGARKLAGWKEEEHEATVFLLRTMKTKK